MTAKKTNKEMEEKAKKRVESKFGLLSHFIVFAVANSLFFGLDFFVTKDADWAFLPLFGWGIGLFIHSLFVVFGDFLDKWKDGAVENEIKKLKEKKD
jgi:hypothetical protein